MKQYGFVHTLKHLYRGQSYARIEMNKALRCETLLGRTLDIGGGRNPDYFSYLQKDENVSVEAVDGLLSTIDLEKDALPYEQGSMDTVLMCNILEHIYNHQFLLGEANRVLKVGGGLVGFVPFWVAYHPDPHDYFRYTDEALTRMLGDVGFEQIRIRAVGKGPILANFNTIVLSIPKLLRPLMFIPYAFLDLLFVTMRPKSAKRNPLGFIFTGVKK